MKNGLRALALFLSFQLAMPPALLAATAAQPSASPTASDTQSAPAPEAQVAVLKDLSKFHLFQALEPMAGKKKPTDGDVTDALAAAFPIVQKAESAALKRDGTAPPAESWAALLELVREKKGALRARGLSAWSYEKKLEKIVKTLDADEAPAAVVPTPVQELPGASREELEALRVKLEARLADASSQTESIRKDVERRSLESEGIKKSLEAERADRLAERADRVAERDSLREELRLVKNLVESLKADLADTDKRLEAVGKEAQAKTLTDDELRQTLSILRKDLHDNVQDVSVLKQKVEKLMAPEKQYARPLDKALGSKWIPGAALLLSIGAVVLAASKK